MNFAAILGALSQAQKRVSPTKWGKLSSFGLMAVLTGCTSFGVGNSDYACQGMPDGVQCMSARDVYEATNDGHVPRPITADQAKQGVTTVPAHVASSSVDADNSADRDAAFVNTYVAPHLPDRPIPIRTPAQVMRIWVAPWEDTNGDLNATGYLYTEIEPRRWVIGDPAPAESPVLRPLQVSRDDSARRTASSSTPN